MTTSLSNYCINSNIQYNPYPLWLAIVYLWCYHAAIHKQRHHSTANSLILCYIFNKYSSDTHDAIYSAVSEFYGSESVEDAKQLLWQSYSSHLGTYPQHKGKKTNEKNLRDIMSSLKIIDRKFSGALPVDF